MELNELINLIKVHLENSPHKVVYDPQYPDELYVVSADYSKLAKTLAIKIKGLCH